MENDWVEIAVRRLFDVLQRVTDRPLPLETMKVIIREAHDEFSDEMCKEKLKTPGNGESSSV